MVLFSLSSPHVLIPLFEPLFLNHSFPELVAKVEYLLSILGLLISNVQ